VKGIAARWKAEDPEIRTMWAARAKGEHEPAPVAAASADVEMEEEEEEAAEDDE